MKKRRSLARSQRVKKRIQTSRRVRNQKAARKVKKEQRVATNLREKRSHQARSLKVAVMLAPVKVKKKAMKVGIEGIQHRRE